MGLFGCLYKLFHRLLHFALLGFVLMIILIGVILIVTLPPLKCPNTCSPGGCTMTTGVWKTSSTSYVCKCESHDDIIGDSCTYKQWSPQAKEQFYAALVLLIPTTILLCCFCCFHFATRENYRRARKRLVRPTEPPPPTSIAPPPPPPEDDEEAQQANAQEDHSEHEEEEQEELDIPTHDTPAEITVRSLRVEIPLAALAKDTTPVTETEAAIVALAINQEFLDENVFSEGSNPAYLEAVVVGTFAADEEIDEMAEYREANEEAERLQQEQQQQQQQQVHQQEETVQVQSTSLRQ